MNNLKQAKQASYFSKTFTFILLFNMKNYISRFAETGKQNNEIILKAKFVSLKIDRNCNTESIFTFTGTAID